MIAPLFRQQSSPPQASATITLEVEGMKCAGCVQVVEKTLAQQQGVQTSVVNLVMQQAQVDYQPQAVTPETLAMLLTQAGFPSTISQDVAVAEAQARALEKRQRFRQQLQQLLMAGGLVLGSGIGHVVDIPGVQLPDTVLWESLANMWFHWGLATVALLGPGRSMLWEGWQGLVRRAPTMDSLVGLGTVTAYAASVVALIWPGLHWECFFDAPVMIVGLILLGRTLEAYARGQATTALEGLLTLRPQIAHVVLSDAEGMADPAGQTMADQTLEMVVDKVQVGHRVRVFPGEQFPVDGDILAGETLVDQSMLTGESLPVARGPGDSVTAGTLNQSGTVTMTVTRVGGETTLAKIIELVTTAQARKAPIQRLADVVAGYFTYGVMAIAGLTLVFWACLGSRWWPEVLPLVIHGMPHDSMVGMLSHGGTADLLLGLKLAIAVLVVACPCALGLATPTAILVGTSLGAEQGLLIRGGDVLERIHTVDTVVFDKTGTLTVGHPAMTQMWVAEDPPHSPEQVWQWVASAETGIRHPLATAIMEWADAQNIQRLEAEGTEVIPGCGVQATVDNHIVQIGTLAWLMSQDISVPVADQARAQHWSQEGHTISVVAIDRQYGGMMAMQDQLKPDAIATVHTLKNMGLAVHLLTGDARNVAIAVASALNLDPDAVQADVLPGEKATAIANLQAQGATVAMVGDGINDAPALAQADVGIALSSGTDVAIETAQIVLMRSHIKGQTAQLGDVVSAIQLSQATFRKIQQNLFWAFAYNGLGIPVAAGLLLPKFGILLSPAGAAAIMAFSSVSVVINALTLRIGWRPPAAVTAQP